MLTSIFPILGGGMSATTAKKAVEKKNVEKQKMSPFRTRGHIESECGCVAIGYMIFFIIIKYDV